MSSFPSVERLLEISKDPVAAMKEIEEQRRYETDRILALRTFEHIPANLERAAAERKQEMTVTFVQTQDYVGVSDTEAQLSPEHLRGQYKILYEMIKEELPRGYQVRLGLGTHHSAIKKDVAIVISWLQKER